MIKLIDVESVREGVSRKQRRKMFMKNLQRVKRVIWIDQAREEDLKLFLSRISPPRNAGPAAIRASKV